MHPKTGQFHTKGNPTRIEVNLEALADNARLLMRALPKGGRLMAVVKADAVAVTGIRTVAAF